MTRMSQVNCKNKHLMTANSCVMSVSNISQKSLVASLWGKTTLFLCWDEIGIENSRRGWTSQPMLVSAPHEEHHSETRVTRSWTCVPVDYKWPSILQVFCRREGKIGLCYPVFSGGLAKDKSVFSQHNWNCRRRLYSQLPAHDWSRIVRENLCQLCVYPFIPWKKKKKKIATA